MEKPNNFYRQLLFKSLPSIAAIVIAAIVGLGLLPSIEPLWMSKGLLLLMVGVKLYLILSLILRQLGKIISDSHRMVHILILFTVLVSMIVISFAFDYYALYLIGEQEFNFQQVPEGFPAWELLFHFLYYSLVTFSSLGYGDITPLSVVGKLLVMLEISLYFLVLLFGVANVNRIQVGQNTNEHN